MNQFTIDPAGPIQGTNGAKVSHDLDTDVTVTATNAAGDTKQFVVKAGEKKTWIPPSNWTSVMFTATGFQSASRSIEWPAAAGGAEG